ncbi:MAG TPA: dihydroorotase [Gammaproteobacteria bacterium]|nr:dihydroorotase [Gammaproteobacteria bacterium]
MRSISITRPDDWHVHLRDDCYLKTTVEDISRYFGRAIVMPNLDPPVVTVPDAKRYQDNIISVIPGGSSFTPLMTLYLTDQTTPEIVSEAKASGFIHAMKLYPAGVTTNSAAGVQAIDDLYPIFEAMQAHQLVLAVHGEVADDSVDIFDREKVFIDRHLTDICSTFPELKIVFEHISTQEAASFVTEASDNVAATITAHHLLFNRNHLLAGGMRPIYYCLPILKRDVHQQALIAAATSGDSSFFLGTDSAPHPRADKEHTCGCAAGAYTAHAAIELYTEVYDEADSLEHLEAFASLSGPDFYGLPRNQDTVTLIEEPWDIPMTQAFGEDELIPIRAGESIRWSVKG